MASVLRMPGISADSAEAVLVEWSVAPGATVSRGDVVATVETEKAVVDLEADTDGVLMKTLAAAGETVSIGGPIAVFIQPGEDSGGEEAVLAGLGLGESPSSGAAERGPQSSGPLEQADEERSQDELVPGATTPEIEHTADQVVAADVSSSGAGATGDGAGRDGTRIFASPLVRRLAQESGLRLEGLRGTGPNKRIVRRDLDRALAEKSAAAAPTGGEVDNGVAPPVVPAAPQAVTPAPAARSAATFTDIPHTKFRRAVANALTASQQQVPHFYLKASCRVDPLLELRASVNQATGAKITFNDFVVKAAAQAMVEVPEMNVIWTPDAVRRFDSVDIAVAMASDRGLLTPVVRSVNTRAMSDVSASIKELSTRANAGRLQQQELEGGSLTISNLGMYAVEEFTAIINPPQVAILAVGAAVVQAVPKDDGALAVGTFVRVVLSVDHRPVDGALAAQWMQKFKELIESPLRLLV